MFEVTITLKDTAVSRVELANWVRHATPHLITNAKDALAVAACLIKGEKWEPEFYMLADNLKQAYGTYIKEVNPFCNVTIVDVPEDNQYTRHFATQKGYYDLMCKGAAGDAEAAIAYCKLELSGDVSHGAMG